MAEPHATKRIPSLLDYAYVIEWLNDRPEDAPMPERFKPLLNDALERARLGYLARDMAAAVTGDVCAETGEPVEFRSPDDDYRTDARWRYGDGSVCRHRIERRQ